MNPGANLARPKIILDRALNVLDAQARTAIQARLEGWFAGQIARHLPVFAQLDAVTRDPAAGAPLRALAAALLEAGGLLPRRAAGALVEALDPEARKRLRAIGVTIGTLDLFAPALLKPAAARWRQRLIELGEPPRAGATVLPRGAGGADLAHGFPPARAAGGARRTWSSGSRARRTMPAAAARRSRPIPRSPPRSGCCPRRLRG